MVTFISFFLYNVFVILSLLSVGKLTGCYIAFFPLVRADLQSCYWQLNSGCGL